MWVDNAKRDHFDFIQKMRDRGIHVAEMHNLLTETAAIPEGKKWILDNQVIPNQVGLGLTAEAASCLVLPASTMATARRRNSACTAGSSLRKSRSIDMLVA